MEESTLTVHDESTPPPRANQRQSQRPGQRPGQHGWAKSQPRAITGQRMPAWMPRQRKTPAVPFGLHNPTRDEGDLKRKRMCQEEIQQSTTNLVKTTLGELTKDEQHAKRFKEEIDQSHAFPELLKNHLGFVNELPSSLQLLTLVGEKWLRSKFTPERK